MGKHLRTRYSVTEVKAVFERYLAREIGVEHAVALLKIRRRQFFTVWQLYRAHPKEFSLESTRTAPPRTIDAKVEARIMQELRKEAEIIRRASNPVTVYNYRYLKETREKKPQVVVSLPTIIRRAKKMDMTRSDRTAKRMSGKSGPTMWGSWCNTIRPIIFGLPRLRPSGL